MVAPNALKNERKYLDSSCKLKQNGIHSQENEASAPKGEQILSLVKGKLKYGEEDSIS